MFVKLRYELSLSGERCSDTGFFRMPIEGLLKRLDRTVRQDVFGKRQSTPPPVLARLGLDAGCWYEIASDFRHLFRRVAKRPACVDSMSSSTVSTLFFCPIYTSFAQRSSWVLTVDRCNNAR